MQRKAMRVTINLNLPDYYRLMDVLKHRQDTAPVRLPGKSKMINEKAERLANIILKQRSRQNKSIPGRKPV